jgi:hypothetical protein
MRKTLIVALAAVAMLLAGTMTAGAQFRMDIDVPWYLQVNLSSQLQADLGAAGSAFEGIDISKFAVVVPNIQAYYVLDGGLLQIGFGARLYTILVMNFLYPSIMAEVQLGKFDVNLNVGGLAGVLLGLGPTFETLTGPWVTMDLSAGYRLTDWFRLGVGAFALAHTDYLDSFPYAVYVSGKFIVNPK